MNLHQQQMNQKQQKKSLLLDIIGICQQNNYGPILEKKLDFILNSPTILLNFMLICLLLKFCVQYQDIHYNFIKKTFIQELYLLFYYYQLNGIDLQLIIGIKQNQHLLSNMDKIKMQKKVQLERLSKVSTQDQQEIINLILKGQFIFRLFKGLLYCLNIFLLDQTYELLLGLIFSSFFFKLYQINFAINFKRLKIIISGSLNSGNKYYIDSYYEQIATILANLKIFKSPINMKRVLQ
ncbi:unnamed protein product [Paramecium pentaurelia]|uniref:Transmembrane protein n=1 Tax=Paramecium pentaurelia TaxID=43138 RepID=A0A8S1XTE7_9CILI|nr:unnamed protein product [Paramecium pentaurelia]